MSAKPNTKQESSRPQATKQITHNPAGQKLRQGSQANKQPSETIANAVKIKYPRDIRRIPSDAIRDTTSFQ